MNDNLKNAGYAFFGIGVAIIVILIIVLLIEGGVWLGEKILPILSIVSGFAFLVSLFIFLPLGLFKKTRGAGGTGLYYASYVHGLSLWVAGFLLTYALWGTVALIIGLFMLGVGVVPIAMLATAFAGEWSIFFQLLILLVLTFGSRGLGLRFIEENELSKLVQSETN